MDRVRAAKKPVLTFALGYADDHLLLAAHASEVWLDPQGFAIATGPGGNRLYFADLLEKIGINARIYRVGSFKSAVEPYVRNAMSDEARANIGAVYEALWAEWQANVNKARPKADLAGVTRDTAGWIAAGGGDLADAALKAGLVDRLGDRVAFGARVAQLAGKDHASDLPGSFAASELDAYLADLGPERGGKAIGVVTIAGDIVDGEAGPGIAGGKRIADLLDEALDDELAALVVRVDSPGGSATAAEQIRRAIQRYRDRKIPVAVSFANVAASGGYWVATASDRIFAQPETITGSIGVFAVVPTFEPIAARLGVTADGYKTTPLSGQPDIVGGFTPEIEAVLQAGVSSTYRDFLARVSEARRMPVAKLDAIAQGRLWDGGAGRQIGLIDQFGGLDEALGWAAARAGLKQGEWHPVFLGEESGEFDPLIRRLLAGRAASPRLAGGDPFALLAQRQNALAAELAYRAERVLGTSGVQAYCLECPLRPLRPTLAKTARQGGMAALLRLLASD
jgi:protease-4